MLVFYKRHAIQMTLVKVHLKVRLRFSIVRNSIPILCNIWRFSFQNPLSPNNVFFLYLSTNMYRFDTSSSASMHHIWSKWYFSRTKIGLMFFKKKKKREKHMKPKGQRIWFARHMTRVSDLERRPTIHSVAIAKFPN